MPINTWWLIGIGSIHGDDDTRVRVCSCLRPGVFLSFFHRPLQGRGSAACLRNRREVFHQGRLKRQASSGRRRRSRSDPLGNLGAAGEMKASHGLLGARLTVPQQRPASVQQVSGGRGGGSACGQPTLEAMRAGGGGTVGCRPAALHGSAHGGAKPRQAGVAKPLGAATRTAGAYCPGDRCAKAHG